MACFRSLFFSLDFYVLYSLCSSTLYSALYSAQQPLLILNPRNTLSTLQQLLSALFLCISTLSLFLVPQAHLAFSSATLTHKALHIAHTTMLLPPVFLMEIPGFVFLLQNGQSCLSFPVVSTTQCLKVCFCMALHVVVPSRCKAIATKLNSRNGICSLNYCTYIKSQNGHLSDFSYWEINLSLTCTLKKYLHYIFSCINNWVLHSS